MVRHTEADDEAKFETVTEADDVEVGDTIDVTGASFLPKSNLEVIDVDADSDWYGDRGVVVTARIPNRSNARDYSFLVTHEFGAVKTTNSAGYFRNPVDMKVEVDPDEDDDPDEDAEFAEGDDVMVKAHYHDDATRGTVVRVCGPSGVTGDTVFRVENDDGDTFQLTADALTPVEDVDDWSQDRGMTGDEDVVPAGKVGFDVDAVAAAWEIADGVTATVGAYVASAFATDDAGNYFGLAPADGEYTDRDAHFVDVEGGDGNTYDVMVEEKAVGIVDDDADVPGRCYKVDIPGRDGKALYVAPPQIFVDKVHDVTAP